ALFVLGGITPMLVAIAMIAFLPESPSFLAARPRLHPKLRTILARFDDTLDFGRGFRAPEGTVAGQKTSIFARRLRIDTFYFWAANFFCLLAVFTMFSWAPTMLSQAGLSLTLASAGLAAFNFGGIFGALAGAALMDRWGSRRPLGVMAAGGAAASLLAWLAILTGSSGELIVGTLAVQGVFIVGLQVTLFALGANIYPETARATGIGAALAVGRLGAIASSLVGAKLLSFGAAPLMLFVAASSAITGAALLAVRGHIAGRRQNRA
ncbi:MAG: major facilitator superfamily transporter, partial [Rubritepida sp.]|nr:major facilitator superfamily transporter [Rubritepida sp.]